MLEELFEIQLRLAAQVPRQFKRFLFAQVNWQARCIGIVGARGVGKTTLMLQYYVENFSSPEECLYLSADHVLVVGYGLYQIAKEFFTLGGRVIIFDEVHKYPSWSQELKNIYDSFPDKKIIFTGSSSLHILKEKADLSRRVVLYKLPGLSFGEFIFLSKGERIGPFDLEKIIQNHVGISSKIAVQCSPIRRLFKEYLKFGYYPFFVEGTLDYENKLLNAVEKVLYEDIPAVWKIKAVNIPILKKILWLIASSSPFEPNIEKMSREFGISKEYVYIYLEVLEKAGLIKTVFPVQKGYRLVRKPAKIYLDNPNLYYVLGGRIFSPQIGSIRECFFVNQLSLKHTVYTALQGDFMIKGFLFEIGGKNKTKKQIAKKENSFLILDDIEIGIGQKIPLYLFGFLY